MKTKTKTKTIPFHIGPATPVERERDRQSKGICGSGALTAITGFGRYDTTKAIYDWRCENPEKHVRGSRLDAQGRCNKALHAGGTYPYEIRAILRDVYKLNVEPFVFYEEHDGDGGSHVAGPNAKYNPDFGASKFQTRNIRVWLDDTREARGNDVFLICARRHWFVVQGDLMTCAGMDDVYDHTTVTFRGCSSSTPEYFARQNMRARTDSRQAHFYRIRATEKSILAKSAFSRPALEPKAEPKPKPKAEAVRIGEVVAQLFADGFDRSAVVEDMLTRKGIVFNRKTVQSIVSRLRAKRRNA